MKLLVSARKNEKDNNNNAMVIISIGGGKQSLKDTNNAYYRLKGITKNIWQWSGHFYFRVSMMQRKRSVPRLLPIFCCFF